VQILLKDENINVNIRDNENFTPLHHACINGSLDIAELLLKKAEVNVISAEGFTPLHCAALSGNASLVSALINRGANVNTVDHLGYNALAFAVREGHLKAATALLSAKANVNSRIVEDDLSILHIAVLCNRRDVLKLLLDNGADVHAVTRKFQNAVHLAAKVGDSEIIQILIDKGADDFSKVLVNIDRPLIQTGFASQYPSRLRHQQ
jgi:ankyrin repeat protein